MAYIEIPGGGFWWPMPPAATTTTIDSTIDATAEKFMAAVFRFPKTGDVDRFEFLLGAVTQAPTNGLRCSFQNLDLATGDPDGTVDEEVTVTTGLTAGTWVDPGAMRKTGVARAVTRGDYGCAVVEFASFVAGDSLACRAALWGPNDGQQFPYTSTFTASWAKQRQASPIMALKYTDGAYYPIGGRSMVMNLLTTSTISASSSPDERALLYQSPFTVPCKIGETWWEGDLDNDASLELYDSDGSVLESVSLDKDVRSIGTPGIHFRELAAERILQPITDYRMSYKPGASASSIKEFDVATAGHLAALQGGTTMRFSSRTDAGAWTDVSTRRLLAGVKVTAIDIPSGGGGLLVHPGMGGGLRG